MPITYCIVCNITGQKYYGSTKTTLNIRMNHHKNYLDCSSKEILLRDDYVVYTLDEYDTIEEARMKEDWYICNNKCINKYRVSLTDEERKQYYKENKKIYYQENKEQISEKRKEHYQENTDDILEKRKEYYQQKKEQIREYKKEYYQQKKEQILEKRKEHYQQKKEKIREKSKEKVECEFCNEYSTSNHLRRHQRTKRCKKFQ